MLIIMAGALKAISVLETIELMVRYMSVEMLVGTEEVPMPLVLVEVFVSKSN
jgi:hypothetical protein